jgi:hypothetical protein
MHDPDFAAPFAMLPLMPQCAVNMAAICPFPIHGRFVLLLKYSFSQWLAITISEFVQ